MRVAYSPRAKRQLDQLYLYLWTEISDQTADAILEDILGRCDSLGTMAHRGAPRDEVLVGLRILPFPRGVIAYTVVGETVNIVSVFYGGQDYLSGRGDS